MTTSHHREVINDHMNDSNWKKLVDLGRLFLAGTALAHRDHTVNAVSKRYCRAHSGAMVSSAAFDNIDRSASTDSIRVWATEEEHAKRERAHDITVMDIYDIKMKRCEFVHSA